MAILNAVPGLNVFAFVDGNALEGYEEDESVPKSVAEEYQAARTVHKYIESMSDKKNCIRANLTSPFKMDFDVLVMDVFIDGTEMNDLIISKPHIPPFF